MDLTNKNNNDIINSNKYEMAIDEIEYAIEEYKSDLNLSTNSISVPIGELSSLGSGVASLIPTFNEITQTTNIATGGLYRLANESVGDALKLAKDGNFWGSFKTAEGKSKFVKLSEVGDLTATTTTKLPIDPATAMMSVALYSIEKQIGEITEISKKILSFLNEQSNAEVIGDVETLVDAIKKYKSNWDNEKFIYSYHKMAIDIQRKCREKVHLYQMQINELINNKQLIVSQGNVDSVYKDIENKFKYYKLSLYSYSLASFLEIMLSGNFKEEYISTIKDEIIKLSTEYRNVFDNASIALEKIGKKSLQANLLNGVGIAENAIGRAIAKIPLVNKGQVDEFLMDKGKETKKSASNMKVKTVRELASLNNPNTSGFINQMNNISMIYNHTNDICFDKDNIYLVADRAYS